MVEYKDLFLNVVFILFSILLFENSIYEKNIPQVQKKWIAAIFMGISMTLSMTFPVIDFIDLRFDLRSIPILLTFLYLGPKFGFLLVAWSIGYRVYLGGAGVQTAFLIHMISTPLYLLASKFYLNLQLKNKFKLSITIACITPLIIIAGNVLHQSVFQTTPVFNTDTFINNGWLSLSFIISAWASVYLVESMLEKKRLREEVEKADKLRLLSQMAASFAHEVRNPLTSTKGFLQLMAEDIRTPKDHIHYLDISKTELDKAEEVISSFLSFAKPDQGELEVVDLASMAIQVANIMDFYAIQHGIKIKTDTAPDCRIYAEKGKISQAVVNMVKNGIEAMPEGGELNIRVWSRENEVFLDVMDAGKGMTSEEIKRLGSPFYSLKENGTGLGLMISYRFIELFHGKIHVVSSPHQGTTFSIGFPKSDQPGFSIKS